MHRIQLLLSSLFLTLVLSASAQTSRECDKFTIYFKNNKSELKGRQQRQLDSLDLKIPQEGTYLIRIIGHTSSKGNGNDNLKLSKVRAKYIEDYITSKYPGRFTIYTFGKGETAPISTNEKNNRRVELQFFNLNDDGTVSFYAEDSSRIQLSAHRIASCDLCKVPLTYKLGDPIVADKLTARQVIVESKCVNTDCLNIEIRLPFDSKLLYSEAGLPYPVIQTCGDTAKYLLDTNFRYRHYRNYLDEFEITIDTASSEFIISHPCFYARHCLNICGFRTSPCREAHFSIDENVLFAQTNVISFYYDTIALLYGYAHPVFGDSNVYCVDHCGISNRPDIIRGYGYINGEIQFLNVRQYNLDYTYDIEKTWTNYYYTRPYNKRYHIKAELYQPLKYGELDVKIKVPRNIGVQNLGLSLEGIEYYIPIDHLKKRWHITKELMFPHDFYIQFEDEKLIVPHETAKMKYKIRRNFIKVKIKRKHIRKYLGSLEMKD
ncbi:MAG: hypothetical protein Crog4KO_23760 [Crocinitomicaceae bacterium]